MTRRCFYQWEEASGLTELLPMINLIAQIQAAAADKGGSADAYIKEIILQLKDILHRIDVLEGDAAWHTKVFLGVVAVIAWFGWKELRRMTLVAAKNVEEKVKARVDTAVAEANEAVAKAKAELSELERRAGTKIYIESGEEEFKLEGGYISAWIRFKTKFPRIPQVFVTEANAGHWIYMKVDNRDLDRFQWAGTSLIPQKAGDAPHRHVGKIQWVAILTEEAKKPTPTAPTPA